MVDAETDRPWYGVRCLIVFRWPDAKGEKRYEERITIWQTSTRDEALLAAEAEVREYAKLLPRGRFIGYQELYDLDGPPGHGAEVFSLIRRSNLKQNRYVDRFFDTGAELQER